MPFNVVRPASFVLVLSAVIAGCGRQPAERDFPAAEKNHAFGDASMEDIELLDSDHSPLTSKEADLFVRQLETLDIPFPEISIEPDSPKVEAEHVYEAVFLHMFDHNVSGLKRNARAFCLEIEKKDPSDAFLHRFVGHKPPVLPASQMQRGKDVQFYVEELKWESPRRAVVLGGYLEGGLSASGNRFVVIRDERQWRVESDERIWISSNSIWGTNRLMFATLR